jgi:hypothetical protein
MTGMERGKLASPTTARIYEFPTPAERNRFGILDRMEVLRWAAIARDAGYARVAICDDAEAEFGDYALIYPAGREWAAWGVARDGAAFCVWRTGAAGLLGRFPTICAALDAILTQPCKRRWRRRRALPGS